jgi:hypothetical protein
MRANHDTTTRELSAEAVHELALDARGLMPADRAAVVLAIVSLSKFGEAEGAEL